MLHKIGVLLSCDWDVSVHHVFREANYYADKLAKLGAKADIGVHWLTAPPSDFLPLLLADLVKVLLPRFCNPQ